MAKEPWSKEKRDKVRARIDAQARLAAKRLGARTVTMIAFFGEGEHLFVQDGGNAPMQRLELYRRLAAEEQATKEASNPSVKIEWKK